MDIFTGFTIGKKNCQENRWWIGTDILLNIVEEKMLFIWELAIRL